MFIRTCHQALPWAKWIQPSSLNHIYLYYNSIFILLPETLPDFLTKLSLTTHLQQLFYFEKIQGNLRDIRSVHVSTNPLINYWTPEPNHTKLVMHIMAHQLISTPYYINTSHQFACLSLISLLNNGSVEFIPPFIARQQLNKTFPRQRITQQRKTCCTFKKKSVDLPMYLRIVAR